MKPLKGEIILKLSKGKVFVKSSKDAISVKSPKVIQISKCEVFIKLSKDEIVVKLSNRFLYNCKRYIFCKIGKGWILICKIAKKCNFYKIDKTVIFVE